MLRQAGRSHSALDWAEIRFGSLCDPEASPHAPFKVQECRIGQAGPEKPGAPPVPPVDAGFAFSSSEISQSGPRKAAHPATFPLDADFAFDFQAEHAARTSTRTAPAALRALAQAEAVAPVVTRSSTSATRSGHFSATKAPRRFAQRSAAPSEA